MSKRYIIVLPFAAIATAGLFGLMTALIRTEWSPQTKSEVLKYEINPQVIDITFPRPDLRPNEIKRIETPPAPPIIDVQKRSNLSSRSQHLKALFQSLNLIRWISQEILP